MADIPELISPKEVVKRTTLCRGTIRNLVLAGTFPQPIRLTDNRIAFKASDVSAWLDSKMGVAA